VALNEFSGDIAESIRIGFAKRALNRYVLPSV
jgi:hypothetical protein